MANLTSLRDTRGRDRQMPGSYSQRRAEGAGGFVMVRRNHSGQCLHKGPLCVCVGSTKADVAGGALHTQSDHPVGKGGSPANSERCGGGSEEQARMSVARAVEDPG